ncbi:MAG: hypothetical protein AYK18_02380 [Theionarchaea archaeon DG-70]|nr:MAG: hypothetical protein AYK18_02380 [Theionarchaea archaeon DG-70]
MNLRGDYMKKNPLRICALTSLVITLVVIFLVSSYAFGISILSRLIPGIPEPRPVIFSSYFPIIFSEVISPLIYLLGSVGILLYMLKHLLAQKCPWGVKPEFILIGYSFIITGLGLQYLGDKILYKENLTDSLYSISLIFAVLGFGSLAIGIAHKYLVEKK